MDEEIHELILPILDEENICLPLPINVVSKYWNIELSLVEAQETAKKYSGFDGSILIEGIESAERNGLSCKILRSSLSELKKIIDSGIPPIVILPGIPEITQHASIITGYDDEEKTILHYIQKGNQKGEQQEGAIPQDIFEKEWNEEGKLLIVLAPSDIISPITFENDSSDKSNRLCFESERSSILKNYSESSEYLQKAIQLDPNNSTAYHLLGTTQNGQNSSDCIKNYEKCLEINDKSYLTFNGLGNFYLKTNQFDKAENSYTKAIEINPKRSAKNFPQASDRGIIEQAIREL
jgi:tetratricopeptide (TPR) repeat protein